MLDNFHPLMQQANVDKTAAYYNDVFVPLGDVVSAMSQENVTKFNAYPPVILQRVPEPKTAKTRVHFDIRVDDVEAKASELERLGATRIDVGQPADASFIPMADPEGNEFCICPGVPLSWGAG